MVINIHKVNCHCDPEKPGLNLMSQHRAHTPLSKHATGMRMYGSHESWSQLLGISTGPHIWECFSASGISAALNETQQAKKVTWAEELRTLLLQSQFLNLSHTSSPARQTPEKNTHRFTTAEFYILLSQI